MNSPAIDLLHVLEKWDNGKDFIPLHEPVFNGNEEAYVSNCIQSGWVSSVGSYVDLFEKKIAEYVNAKHAIVTVNGTSALHICLVALDIDHRHEVLLPSLTFVATANAIAYSGAMPHFCDSSEKDLGICSTKLDAYLSEISIMNDKGQCINKNTQKHIKAIIPMHCLGHPTDMESLSSVCQKYNIEIIEDAAESLGSKIGNAHTGTFGRLGAISFNGNKIITTGGGGAVVTDDAILAKNIKHLTTTAKTSKEGFFHHDQIGYNYRMPNLNAALGCAQIEKIEDRIAQKRLIAEQYLREISGIDGLNFIPEPEGTRSNYWLCSARFNHYEDLKEALECTNKNKIMTRPLWNLLHTLPMYAHCPSSNLDNAQKLVRSVISLPSTINLTMKNEA